VRNLRDNSLTAISNNCRIKEAYPKGISKYLLLTLVISFISSITLIFPPGISAQEIDGQAELSTTRPDPKGVPTKVRVHLFVINIESVSDAEQSYKANVAIFATWKDPRLVCKPGQDPDLIRTYKLDQVWHPSVYILNQRRVFKQGKDVIRVDCVGNAEYSQIFYGDFLTLANIKDFPFDARPLNIDVISKEYGPEEVELSLEEEFTGRTDKFSITDWYIDSTPTTESSVYKVKGKFAQKSFSRLIFSFNADRNTQYYIWKIIVPMMLIVFMSWCVFWIPLDQLGAKIGLSVTSMLTLIAYRFALSNLTPKVDYLTRFDKFTFASTLLIFLALVVTVATGSLSAKGRGELAEKIGSYSKFVFPAAFIMVIILSFLV
jgi:hypothetical protein